MKYIKFDENGNAFEAPAKMKTEAGTIFGYNNEKNEDRLLADGWLKYDGKAPLSKLKLDNGEIIIKADPARPPKAAKTVFTKLEIRRALRKLGKEDILDNALQVPQFKKDWTDAQEIDLNDEMMQTAITSGFISQAVLEDLKKEIK